MAEYEIRFLKGDGTATLIFWTLAFSDGGAIAALRRMNGLDHDVAEIWLDFDCVHREKGPPLRHLRAVA